jgi:TP901 family phage tail tape measure protein
MFDKIGLGVVLEFLGGDSAVRGMNQVHRATEQMHRGFRDVSQGVGQIGSSLAPTVIGLGTSVAGAVQRFASFETGLAKIGTVLPGGIEEAKQYGGAIEEASLRFGKAGADVADGFNEALQAGVTTKNLAGFMDVALKAAASGFTETRVAVDGLTNVLNAYASAAPPVMQVSDQMFKAVQIGKLSFAEFAANIGKVAPTAALAKIGFDEVAAAMASMTSVGIDPATTAVSLNQAMLAFINPGKKAQSIAKKYGIELSAASLKSKGLARSLADVSEKLGGNEEALVSIFGNVRAFRAAASIGVGEGAKQYAETIAQVRGTAGVTERNFRDVSNTIEVKFKRALMGADAAARRVGGAFVEVFGLGGESANAADVIAGKLDMIEASARGAFSFVKLGFEQLDLPGKLATLRDALGPLKEAIDGAFGGESSKRALQLASAIAVVAAAAAPVIFVLKPITGAIAGLLLVGKGLFGMVSGLGGLFGGFGALLSGPVIAAVAAVGVVIAAFATNAGGSRDALMGLMGTIGSLVRNFIMPLVEQIATALRPTFEVLTQVIGTMLVPMIETLQQYWTALLPPITKIIGHLVNIVGKVLPPLIAIISHGLMPVINAIQWGMQNILIPAFDGVITVIEKLLGWLSDLVGWLTDAYTEIGKFFGLIDEQADKAIRGVDKVNRARDAAGVEGVPREAPRIATEIGNTSAAAGGAQAAVAGAVAAEAARSTPVQIDSNLYIDGRNMAVATSRAQLEITERSGADVTPWQRRMIIEHGARPVVVGG